MIFLGYIAVFSYVFALIFLLGPLVQKHSNTETSRKTVHTGLFLVWVLIDLFFKASIHQIIIPVLFLILNTLSNKFVIYKSVERDNSDDKGTIYFAAAITVIMTVAYFCPEFYYASGMASFCLTFGDGFAALIGYNTRSKMLRDGKSLNGFLACSFFSSLSLIAFRFIYGAEASFAGLIAAGLFAALLELTGKGLDNFSVTFGTFLLSYLLLEHGSTEMTVGIAAAAVIFCIVFFSGSIDYAGSLLSSFMVFCFYYFGGLFGILYLLCTFFTIFFISVVKKKLRPDLKKDKGRRFVQILINGGLGCLFVILYGLCGRTEYLVVSVIAIGGCFVDSLSSDVGIMSMKKPYDPWRRKTVEPGISGGVTLLGTAAALIGSVLIGISTTLALSLRWTDLLIITLVVFLQTAVDTLLGSSLQVKYRCTVCGRTTEKKVHCSAPTEYLAGRQRIDNNAVNLLSSLVITAIACRIFIH